MLPQCILSAGGKKKTQKVLKIVKLVQSEAINGRPHVAPKASDQPER